MGGRSSSGFVSLAPRGAVDESEARTTKDQRASCGVVWCGAVWCGACACACVSVSLVVDFGLGATLLGNRSLDRSTPPMHRDHSPEMVNDTQGCGPYRTGSEGEARVSIEWQADNKAVYVSDECF